MKKKENSQIKFCRKILVKKINIKYQINKKQN